MADDTSEQPRPIVVGVDGSITSKAALAWGVTQAVLTGAPIHAVITWEIPTNYGWAIPWPDGMDFAADAGALLDKTISEVIADGVAVEVTKSVVEGHAALVLVDITKDADLLVVGSHGHGAFAGMLMGSVSAYTVAHAACPVVVVHGEHPQDARNK